MANNHRTCNLLRQYCKKRISHRKYAFCVRHNIFIRICRLSSWSSARRACAVGRSRWLLIILCVSFFLVRFSCRSRGILLLLLFHYYPLSRVPHNIIRVALIMRPPTCLALPSGPSVRPSVCTMLYLMNHES